MLPFAVVMIVAAVLVIAASSERVNADTVNLTLYGSAALGWGFANNTISSPGPTITANQNDNINLTLVSQDGNVHQFFIDYNNNSQVDAGEPASLPFVQPIVFRFNVTRSGNFTYRCSIHPAMMFGTFMVEQAVPEFPSFMLLPLFAVSTLLVTIVYGTKRSQQKTLQKTFSFR